LSHLCFQYAEYEHHVQALERFACSKYQQKTCRKDDAPYASVGSNIKKAYDKFLEKSSFFAQQFAEFVVGLFDVGANRSIGHIFLSAVIVEVDEMAYFQAIV
jgi:hypothetical protein